MSTERGKAQCISVAADGKGIVDYDGEIFRISGVLKDEKLTIEVSRTKKGDTASLVSIDEPSPERNEPPCPIYGKCGGCQLQHMTYKAQLKFKQEIVKKLMGHHCTVEDTIGMDEPYWYRNKIHSTLTVDAKGNIISGIYEENSHRVVSAVNCMIQDKRANEVIAAVVKAMKQCKLRPYNEDGGYGLVRHILIKRGIYTDQTMVVIVVASNIFPGRNNFVTALRKSCPFIDTIVMNVNDRKTSMVLGDAERVLYGRGYIEDTLCGYTFRISPKSFYQINTLQTEKLYQAAIDMAELKGTEQVLDAYCGIGTISIIASASCKSVIGVEVNKNAVQDAMSNARRNKIKNAYYYNDDAGNFMVNLAQNKEKIDTVFIDPPRSGCDERFMKSLLKLNPEKIIYISCNPVTQIRDVEYLAGKGYTVKAIQPVDMFPQTDEIECIVKLCAL